MRAFTVLFAVLLATAYACRTPAPGARLEAVSAGVFVACANFAADELAARGTDQYGIPNSPFRFGYAVDEARRQSQPQDVAGWCLPPKQVNCGKWDEVPGVWKAPKGCACYAEGKGRSYENCNDGELFACPWSSGAGCGLHVLGELGGIACSPGPLPQRPEVNTCFFDVVGTTHDACCARHWYDEMTIKWHGKSIIDWDCNGCNRGYNAQTCSPVPFGVRVPQNAGLPCLGEWRLAVDHNRLVGETRYPWFGAVDTEERLTPREVALYRDRPDLLIGAQRLAPPGHILLKIDGAAGVLDEAHVARFCRSGQVAVREIDVGLLQVKDAWVCL